MSGTAQPTDGRPLCRCGHTFEQHEPLGQGNLRNRRGFCAATTLEPPGAAVQILRECGCVEYEPAELLK